MPSPFPPLLLLAAFSFCNEGESAGSSPEGGLALITVLFRFGFSISKTWPSGREGEGELGFVSGTREEVEG